MRKSIALIFISLLGVLTNAYSPTVKNISPIPDAYLRINEVHQIDLSDHFTGFNLSFQSNSGTIQKPLTMVQGGAFDIALIPGTLNIVSQTIPRNILGNIDYNSRVLYVTENNYVYWATVNNASAAPTVDAGVQLTPSKSVHCYDAAVVNSELIIVDCSSVNATDKTQTDWFYYVNTTSRKVVNKISSPAILETIWDPNFSNSTRGVRFADYDEHNRFIFRYVGADAITKYEEKGNSYIEVWNAYQPTNPTHIRNITHSDLKADGLWLASFEVLNNNLFIVCERGKVYSIRNFEIDFEDLVINSVTIPETPLGLSSAVESDWFTQKLTIIVYSDIAVYEYDWSDIHNPISHKNYTLASGSSVLKADVTNNFLHVHFATGPLNDSLATIRRGFSEVNGTDQLYHSVSVPKVRNTVFWYVDRTMDNVYMYDVRNKYAHNFHYSKPYLLVDIRTPGTGAVEVSATSTTSDGKNKTENATLNYAAIAEDDYDVHIRDNSTLEDMMVDFPLNYTISLKGFAYGPGIQYSSNVNGSTRNFENLTLSTPDKLDLAGASFHKIVANASEVGKFNWFVQVKDTLYSYICADSLNVTSQLVDLSCITINTTKIEGQITNLVATADYIALTTTAHNGSIFFYESTLELLKEVPLGEGTDIYACKDLTLTSSGLLLCAQPIVKQIAVWISYNDTPFIINRQVISARNAAIFSPQSIQTSPSFSDLIFINNNVDILIVNIANFISDNVAEVVGSLDIPDEFLQAPSFDFLVISDSILCFLTDNKTTSLREYSFASSLVAPVFIKQYSDFDNSNLQIGTGSHFDSKYTRRFFSVGQYAESELPHLTAFEAGAEANSNYLQSLSAGNDKGRALLSGVRSSVVAAEYLIVISPSGTLFPYIAYDTPSFVLSTNINNKTNVVESSDVVLTIASSLGNSTSNNLRFQLTTYNPQPEVSPAKNTNGTHTIDITEDVNSPNVNVSEIAFNPSDYFEGVVTNWTVVPEKAEDAGKVVIVPPVHKVDSAIYSNANINDVFHTDKTVYGQTNDTLLIIDTSVGHADNKVFMTLNNIPSSVPLCTHVVASEDDVATTSYCLDATTGKGYFVIVTHPSPLTIHDPIPSNLSSIDSLKRVGTTLFVFVSRKDPVTTLQSSSELHYFSYDNATTISYKGKVDEKTFGTGNFQIGSFDVLNLANGKYRLYFTDVKLGVRTAEWDGTNWTNPQDVSLADLQIPASASFIGIGIVKHNDSNTVYVALTTDTYRVYYVRLVSAASGLTAKLLSSYEKISAAINNNKVAAISVGNFSYFAVSNCERTSGNGYVTLYNATGFDNDTEVVTHGDYVTRLNFPGAFIGSKAFDFTLFNNTARLWAYVVYDRNNIKPQATQDILEAEGAINQTLDQYQVDPAYIIKVLNYTLTSNYFNIVGSNAHSSSSVKLNFVHPGNHNDDPGSSKWWVWLLVVLGIVAVAGAIYAYMKARKAKQDNEEGVEATYAHL